MATLQSLQEELGLKPLTSLPEGQEVTRGYVCDLISWVMARGEPGMAWITVQTHHTVTAVAVLHDFACVIVPEGIEVPKETLEKAEEEGVPFFSSDQTAYQLCCAMAKMGITE